MDKLNNNQFDKFTKLIYEKLGIYISEAKREMIQSKVSKLMRAVNIECFDEYHDFLLSNNKNGHWSKFVDEITIHKTNFFREDNHFEFIRNKLDSIFKHNPRILRNNEIRVWSSACSNGKEAYTLAIVLKEYLPAGINIKILATDVSAGVIEKAQKAVYTLDAEDMINPYFLGKYFNKVGSEYEVIQELKNLITFRTFNLMDIFPFQNSFDIIFCRNVMIYFDFKTQENLIKKFYNVLPGGGLLFIGHSESLNQKQYKFEYIQPTVYMKKNI
ncbi:MAG: CheR family methyltransferase [bacterium]